MKVTKEKFKTYGNVFDQFTERNLFRLSSSGLFTQLQSTVSPGKEANVFTAAREDGSLVAVKIYRLEGCNFNKMWSYLQTDPRYKGSKPRRRELIFAWVKREYHNLMKAREAGVRVPTPYKVFHNIIVEEFIDQEQKPAPQLKDAELEDPQFVATQIFNMIKKLYAHGLIHGDLSEFNILIQNGQPVFIDMSQGTDPLDQQAGEYLQRDVRNVSRFFGINDVDAIVDWIKDGKEKSKFPAVFEE